MVPPEQCFDTCYVAGAKVDFGLIKEFELVAIHGRVAALQASESSSTVLVAIVSVSLVAGVSFLSHVHCDVGALQKGVNVRSVFGIESDAETRLTSMTRPEDTSSRTNGISIAAMIRSATSIESCSLPTLGSNAMNSSPPSRANVSTSRSTSFTRGPIRRSREGYGWCGKGRRRRAQGQGAQVVVTEVDPLKALEAVMDGFRVMPMIEAAPIGDVFITVTGYIHVIRREHFEAMKDGAIVARTAAISTSTSTSRCRGRWLRRSARCGDFVTEYAVGDKKIFVLGDGRLINLAAAEGHPASVMDMSFANQSLACEQISGKHSDELPEGVSSVPRDIDAEIARLKLVALGVDIDELTGEQKKYLASWEMGT